MARTHTFPTDAVHYTWDAGNAPVIAIDSGDTVVVTTRDVSDGQLSPTADATVLDAVDWDRSYPLAGPIAIRGAEPGDTLAIDVVDLQTKGWGWTGVMPDLGLLSEEFPEAYLRVFDLTTGDTASFREDIAIPVEPFLGTMGVCPLGAEGQSVMPPGVFGGNIDMRQLTVGSTLYVPVQVAGALFSCGDAHAAQGDGEVCGTGIEAPMDATLRFSLEKGRSIQAPQFLTTGPLAPRVEGAGFYGVTGLGADLYAAAQDAIRGMIDHLARAYELSREDAYMLCSLCVDLKISEIVNAGEFVVSAVLPLAVFQARTP